MKKKVKCFHKLKVGILSILYLLPFAVFAGNTDSVVSQPITVFEEVWQLVYENFYDPTFNNLNWNEVKKKYTPLAKAAESIEVASVIINNMLAELNTSHTHFYTKFDPEYYQLLDIFKSGPLGKQIKALFPDGKISYPGIGIITTNINGTIFIKGVLEGSPADKAGLKVGYRIISVNGERYHPVKPFLNNVGKEISVKVQYASNPNSTKDIQVIPKNIIASELFFEAMKHSMTIIERNNKTIGYVRVWSYAGEKYHKLLKNEIAFGKFRNADALILDLRDGWGGANPDYLNLFNKNVPIMTWVSRNGEQMPIDFQWRKPVAMLVNECTRSGKELLAYGFKKFKVGKVIGSKTAGAVIGGRFFLLQDGSALYLAVQGSRIDGEILEGKGVIPDIEVPFSLEYCDMNDPQLEKAIDVLSGAKH